LKRYSARTAFAPWKRNRPVMIRAGRVVIMLGNLFPICSTASSELFWERVVSLISRVIELIERRVKSRTRTVMVPGKKASRTSRMIRERLVDLLVAVQPTRCFSLLF